MAWIEGHWCCGPLTKLLAHCKNKSSIFSPFPGCLKYCHQALSTLLFLLGLTWIHLADRRLHNSSRQSAKYKHVGSKYGNADCPCSREMAQLLVRFRFLYSNRCRLISAMWNWALGADTMAAEVWNCRIRWHARTAKVFHQKDKVWEIISSLIPQHHLHSKSKTWVSEYC